MTRTLEGILNSHRLASERRAAGKPIWDKTIDIRSIIHEDQDNQSYEHAASVANRIGALLRSSVPKGWLDYGDDAADWQLIEIVEGMEALRPDSYDDVGEDEEDPITPLSDLNEMLAGLYDWADEKRIFLG